MVVHADFRYLFLLLPFRPSHPPAQKTTTTTIFIRDVRPFLPRLIVRYEPFGVVGESGICHFNFHFNQGNAPNSILYRSAPKYPQTQTVLLLSATLVRLVTRTRVLLRVVCITQIVRPHPTRPVHPPQSLRCVANDGSSTNTLEHSQTAKSRLLPFRPHVLRLRRNSLDLQRSPVSR